MSRHSFRLVQTNSNLVSSVMRLVFDRVLCDQHYSGNRSSHSRRMELFRWRGELHSMGALHYDRCLCNSFSLQSIVALPMGLRSDGNFHRIFGAALSSRSIRHLRHLRDHVPGNHENASARPLAIFHLDRWFRLDVLRCASIHAGSSSIGTAASVYDHHEIRDDDVGWTGIQPFLHRNSRWTTFRQYKSGRSSYLRNHHADSSDESARRFGHRWPDGDSTECSTETFGHAGKCRRDFERLHPHRRPSGAISYQSGEENSQ